jgi:lipoprotein signal peptidase
MGTIVIYSLLYTFFMFSLENLSKYRIVGKTVGAIIVIGTIAMLLTGHVTPEVIETPTVSMIIGGAVGLLFG